MMGCGIESFRVLCDRANLSRHALSTLRQGKAELLKYQDLVRLGQVLQVSPQQLIQSFSSLAVESGVDSLKAEYQRLQQQLDNQRQATKIEFQQEAIQQLESLLLQLPTAAYAAQNNPSMPARNLLPLLRPINELLKRWGITAIAEVGAQVSYDPHLHQLMDADTQAEVGMPVTVRYVGYREGDKLLYRARVSS